MARLAGARPLADLLLRARTMQVEGFGVDFVSWGRYRPVGVAQLLAPSLGG